MELMLYHVSNLLRPGIVNGITKGLYRGVLRILLILHHDFPEFLAENHYRLCNTIPPHCTQLRNLVLSAFPSSILELPDPFTAGLKVDRLDEIRKAPTIAGDIMGPLHEGNLKDIIDDALNSSSIPDKNITQIVEVINELTEGSSALQLDTALPHAIVLYIGHSAISPSSGKNGPSFIPESPQASFMSKLARELQPEARYFFLSAIANQLRYPNSHTHFFSYTLIHLFGNDLADQQESDVRQQITRVLVERLIVHRPHPWGLIITLLELIKNPNYMFWDLPFIKANPDVSHSTISQWWQDHSGTDRLCACRSRNCSKGSSSRLIGVLGFRDRYRRTDCALYRRLPLAIEFPVARISARRETVTYL